MTYSGFTAEAQAAFQRAVDIWTGLVASARPVRVSATFSTLGPGILGSAGTDGITRDFTGAPFSSTWYGNALADALTGTNLISSQPFEISANFSNSFGWYYGTDGYPPAGRYDFVSVVLHELGHGLGFYGSGTVSSGTGQLGQSSFPYVYDLFAVTETGAALLTAFANPSVALGTQLTQNYSSSVPRGPGVYFSGTSTNASNGGVSARLYTVNPWNSGSSYSHLNEATYAAGSADSLMTHAIGSAEAIHHPGNVTLGMFKDMGWSTCPASLGATSTTVGSGATSGSAAVTIESGCVWAASSQSAFLAITSGASGTGSGTVGFSVAANNTGSARQGTLRISGVTYTVTQSATSTVPDAPTNVSGARGNGQVTVSFTAPVSTGGSAITGYAATASPGGATATGTGSPLVVTGLTNGTSYTFTVTATNAGGTGPASAASAPVTPATVPAAPSNVSGVAGNGEVSVSFTAPSTTGGAAITAYTVTASPGGATVTGTSSPTVVTGLTNGTAYTFTVTATNSVGTSAASSASAPVTPSRAPFTDDPLQAGITSLKAVHITELRTYVDTLRRRYGLAAVAWTDPTLVTGTTRIKAVHVTELRTALSAAYVAAGLAPPTFADTITAGSSTIRAAQIVEIRNAILAIY